MNSYDTGFDLFTHQANTLKYKNVKFYKQKTSCVILLEMSA
jgi:hypothetical protein